MSEYVAGEGLERGDMVFLSSTGVDYKLKPADPPREDEVK